MRILKCDTCGKKVEKENDLRQIEGKYRSEGKEEYCDDCHYKFTDYLVRLREVHEKTEIESGIAYIKQTK